MLLIRQSQGELSLCKDLDSYMNLPTLLTGTNSSREDEDLFCGADCPTIDEATDRIMNNNDLPADEAFYEYMRPCESLS